MPNIVESRIIWVIPTPIEPWITIVPYNPTGILKSAIWVNKFGTDHTYVIEVIKHINQLVNPARGYLCVVIQKKNVFTSCKCRTFVSTANKSFGGTVPDKLNAFYDSLELS